MNSKVSECYDFMLTQLENELYFIQNGDQLQILSI
jgi:hypothetical protein